MKRKVPAVFFLLLAESDNLSIVTEGNEDEWMEYIVQKGCELCDARAMSDEPSDAYAKSLFANFALFLGMNIFPNNMRKDTSVELIKFADEKMLTMARKYAKLGITNATVIGRKCIDLYDALGSVDAKREIYCSDWLKGLEEIKLKFDENVSSIPAQNDLIINMLDKQYEQSVRAEDARAKDAIINQRQQGIISEKIDEIQDDVREIKQTLKELADAKVEEVWNEAKAKAMEDAKNEAVDLFGPLWNKLNHREQREIINALYLMKTAQGAATYDSRGICICVCAAYEGALGYIFKRRWYNYLKNNHASERSIPDIWRNKKNPNGMKNANQADFTLRSLAFFFGFEWNDQAYKMVDDESGKCLLEDYLDGALSADDWWEQFTDENGICDKTVEANGKWRIDSAHPKKELSLQDAADCYNAIIGGGIHGDEDPLLIQFLKLLPDGFIPPKK